MRHPRPQSPHRVSSFHLLFLPAYVIFLAEIMGYSRLMQTVRVHAFSPSQRGGNLKSTASTCIRRRTTSTTSTRQFSSTLRLSPPSSSVNDPPALVSTRLDLESGYETIFDVMLPEGRCVGVRVGALQDAPTNNDHMPHCDHVSPPLMHETNSEGSCSNITAITTTTVFALWVHDALHPDEVAFASQLSSEASQKSFIGGRLALRQAMSCQVQDCILLKDVHGRPTLPPAFLGSISHKGDVAVALVAPRISSTTTARAIGVDLEVRQKGHQRIARRVLTPAEQQNLGLLEKVDAEQEVLLRFSAKEAIYKAMHPLICQYVSFQEAETQPLVDGTVQVDLNLTSGAHRGFDSTSAHWRILDDYFLTSASVRLKPGVQPLAEDDECAM